MGRKGGHHKWRTCIANISFIFFSVVEVNEVAVGTQFQALSIDNIRGNENFIASFKAAQQVVHNGPNKAWGKIVDPPVNKYRGGLGSSVKNN